MNKIKKVFISLLAASDVFMTVVTPILLALVWLAIFGIKGHWSSYTLIVLACLSSFFRAIKIGWIKR